MAVDIVATLVRVLSESEDVTVPVYGGNAPANTAVPYVAVSMIAMRPTTRPSAVWYDSVTAVDVYSEDPLELFGLVDTVLNVIDTVAGVAQTEGVIARCEVANATYLEDGEFTPIRYRYNVTVETTARPN